MPADAGVSVSGRHLAEHRPFAHEHEQLRDFHDAVEQIKPTGIIGASAQPKMFDQRVLETMAKNAERPIVFALSNPTSKAECTPEEAYRWTGGRAIYASGSPFPPITHEGRTYQTGQANNAYIFPGVGLGAIVCEAARVTDQMFYAAANVLANQVSEDDLKLGRVYPSLQRIREVSAAIAAAVAEEAYDKGLAGRPRPDDLLEWITSEMYVPDYEDYV